jgi:hypothetical protein
MRPNRKFDEDGNFLEPPKERRAFCDMPFPQQAAFARQIEARQKIFASVVLPTCAEAVSVTKRQGSSGLRAFRTSLKKGNRALL